MRKKRELKIRPKGEVSDLVFQFGCYCGTASPGIHIEIERYESKHYKANQRGGVLTKSQVKKIIKFLQENIDDCKEDGVYTK